ncbi:MAG TPA: hypothetical protein VHN16_05020 [Streptosporangiaceae bacterium]|nr:hypothetical protein [Streptosporangiaceae bacterium]
MPEDACEMLATGNGAMSYLPRQGPEFETWLNQADPVGARIAAEKMFTYAVDG